MCDWQHTESGKCAVVGAHIHCACQFCLCPVASSHVVMFAGTAESRPVFSSHWTLLAVSLVGRSRLKDALPPSTHSL